MLRVFGGGRGAWGVGGKIGGHSIGVIFGCGARTGCCHVAERGFLFFKQKTAYDLGLGIPAEPLFRSLVLILLLMPTLNFLPVWFALSLLRFRLPSRLPMMFILWMVAMMVVIIPSRTV